MPFKYTHTQIYIFGKRGREKGAKKTNAGLQGISQHRFPSSASQESTVQNAHQKLTSYDTTDDLHYSATDGDNVLVINDTLMVIDMSEKGTMGCAFFSTSDNCLSAAQDVLLADEQTLQQFLTHIQPTSIFISARFPDELVRMLDEHVDRSINGKLYGAQSQDYRY